MHILVLNCGSSSLKFQLIETSEAQIRDDSDRALAHGSVEKIGSPDGRVTYQVLGGEKEEKSVSAPEHTDAIRIAFDHLTAPGSPLTDPKQIEAVGHRIVHGGEDFQESVLIDADVLRRIESLSELAPLHNPHNLKGYYASRELLPDAAQAAVFDTAFHHTLPPRAYLYGIPSEFYTRDKIRRYGFHGTSHRYISWRYARLLGTTRDTLRLITCHLGNGCSACAIDHGKSVDTSMGFTPMSGLLMGTRPGDLDAGAVIFMINRNPGGAHAVDALLNQHSGLAGMTGGLGDMRDLLAARDKGDAHARDAVDLFCYRVVQYIGAYATVMGGVDAILFAGGIGENAAPIRKQICEGLGLLGVKLDGARNEEARGGNAQISAGGSGVPVWVIPTDEELVIARDTFRCIHKIDHD